MKITFKKLLIIAFYIGLILISTRSYAVETGKTTNDLTRVRKAATVDSEVVVTLSKDAEVEVLSEENGWYKISYKKNTGYIRKDLLEVKGSKNEKTTQDEKHNNTSNENTENAVNTKNEKQESNVTATEDETSTKTDLDSIKSDVANNEIENTSQNTTSDANTENLQNGYKGNLSISVGLRLLPTINSGIKKTMPENTSYTITDVMNKWCYIETESDSGWVCLSKLASDAKSKLLDAQVSKEVSEENQEEQQNQENKVDQEQEDKQQENQEEKKEEQKQEDVKKEEPKTVTKYVSTETLNVREKPENSAKIVAQITLNTQITVLEEVDSTWSKIKVKSTTGYVASKFLSDKKTDKSSRSENLTRTNIDEENSKEDAIDSSKNNETTEKTTTNTESTKKENSNDTSKTGVAVVQYAKQFLGYKYVSGGSSPSTGFDCSGFTSYVYKHFGVTLNRVSKDQINNGTAVSKSELKEGDIVLFKGSSGSAIGHVGIYIGGNMFIHAANPSKGVVTTSLSDSYYSQRYVAARRIFN